MLLNDKDISFTLYIKEGAAFMDDGIVRKLLENTGIDTGRIVRGRGNLITVDRRGGTVIYSDVPKMQKTVFGELAVRDGENGYCLYLDGDGKIKLEPSVEAGVIVFNNEDGQVAATGRFRKEGSDYRLIP